MTQNHGDGECTELMDSKLKLGDDQLKKKLHNNPKNWGIYNLNSVKISRVLRILASQNRFQ